MYYIVLKESCEWKTQLLVKVIFRSSKDTREEPDKYLQSKNVIIMIGERTDRGSDFFFRCVSQLNCYFHKISMNHVGSYLDFPDSIRNEKATINPINKIDSNSFQFSLTVS